MCGNARVIVTNDVTTAFGRPRSPISLISSRVFSVSSFTKRDSRFTGSGHTLFTGTAVALII